MNNSLIFNELSLVTSIEKSLPIHGGYLLSGSKLSISLPYKPHQFYRHGWQSWSLTTWVDITCKIPPLKPNVLHPMQTDPGYVFSENHNGSWVGAVDTQNGHVVLLGALGLEAHVELDGQILKGWYETGTGDWFVACGPEQAVLARYAGLLGERFGHGHITEQPRVWCTWYSLFTEIYEGQLLNIFKELGVLPFDIFQIDDGWQKGIGDWDPNEKFPSGMDGIATKIRLLGRIPGLWMAPLLVVPSSNIFFQHPDWLLRNEQGQCVSAGFNWGEPLFALDTTHPEVLDWLTLLMKKVRTWGYDYLKLDFLYAGALPGKRHNGMPRETAYRHGLKVIRAALGDAYILTCGAPILPSLGLCDGLRVGPDVASYWDGFRDSHLLNNLSAPGVQNAIRTTVNRLWLSSLVHTDPDVVYFRTHNNNLLTEQKQLLQDLVQVTGYKATSDPPSWLNADERNALNNFLETKPKVERTGRYTFHINGRAVDFSPAMPIHDPLNLPLRVVGFFLGWITNAHWVLRLNDWLGRKLVAPVIKDTKR